MCDCKCQKFDDIILQELARADAKHGTWLDEPVNLGSMRDWLLAEFMEVHNAVLATDFDGEHGVDSETAQLVVVALKIRRRLLAERPEPLEDVIIYDSQRTGTTC